MSTTPVSLPLKNKVTGSLLKITLTIVLVLCVVGFFVYKALFGMAVETQVVIQTELSQTVVASGRVTWPQRVSVATEISRRVKHIPVKEGQRVQRGQILIELDNDTELASLDQARAAVDLAELQLRQLKEVELPTKQEALLQTQADVELALQQLNRISQLNQQNYISENELENAQRNLSVAQSKQEAAQLQVVTNQANGSAFVLVVAALNQARANLQLAQAKLAQTTVFAVADGTLISRNIEPGNMAVSGSELMVLAVEGETLIEVQIDEKNLAKLVLGQQALCSADAFPQQRFNAEIIYINPSVDASRGAIEVKLRVLNPPTYLRQDMTVSVDIQTANKNDVLVIPSSTLRDSETDAPWVMVVRDQKAVRQAVTLGLRGDDNVEVLSGLTAGEPLIPANLATIKAGQRVRAVLP